MDHSTVVTTLSAAQSAAKALSGIGNVLRKLATSADSLSGEAESFVDEVRALGAASEAFGQRLTVILQTYRSTSQGNWKSPSTSEQIWMCLQIQSNACLRNAQGLQVALSYDSKRNDNASWRALLEHLMAYFKVSSVAETRERIKSYTTGLQIVLLGIAMYRQSNCVTHKDKRADGRRRTLLYLLPQRVDQQLRVQLTTLANMNRELSTLVAKRDDTSVPSDDSTDAAILAASSRIVASGELLCGTSPASASR